MTHGSINVKITINAQIGDGDVHEIGTAHLPVTAAAHGKVTLDLEQAIRDALCDHEPCAKHKLVQHRDGKPPWCNACRQR